jgi:hypothetical protein
MSRCSKLPPSFRFLQQNPRTTLSPTHTCHMPCPSHPPPVDRPNNSEIKTPSSNKPQITDRLLFYNESGLFVFNRFLHKVIQTNSQYCLLTCPNTPSRIPNWTPSPNVITYGHFHTEELPCLGLWGILQDRLPSARCWKVFCISVFVDIFVRPFMWCGYTYANNHRQY